MGDEVAVSGDLMVTGKETVYSTLTAASGKRHFKITSGAHRVSLSWLNMTGGNVGSGNDGGSIYVRNVAAHLDISHCVFFNNRAGGNGGAIYARDGQANLFFSFARFTENKADNSGGAVYLDRAKLVDHSSMYNMNTAGWGGALRLNPGSHSSLFNSSLVSNTAGRGGGGIYILGYSPSSFLNMSSVTLQSNKQIAGGTIGYQGGGGLYLLGKVTANIRECTFIRNEATEGSTGNKHGHQVFTYKKGSLIPSIAIVNTNFTDVSGSNAFYG
jgi:predicted outer membrane repeat protein